MRTVGALVLFMVVAAGCVQPGPSPHPRSALACAEPCVLTIAEAKAFWEPMLTVNPLDPDHLVVATLEVEPTSLATDEFWGVAHVSFDGGASWARSRLPGGPGADPMHPLAPFTTLGDPAAIVLDDGTVLFAGLAVRARAAAPALFSSNGLSIFLARSLDGGLTWPDVRIVAEGRGTFTGAAVAGATALMLDKPWMARGGDGTVLLVWSHHVFLNSMVGYRDEIWSATTRDRGETWGSPAPVVEGASFYWGASPGIGADGTWFAAYFQNDDAARVMLATSRNRGSTWMYQEIATSAPFQFPQLALVPGRLGEQLVVAYSADAGAGNSTPVAKVSKDGGRTWSLAVALDHAPARTYWPQPMLAAESDGRYYVTFDRHHEDGTVERMLVAMDGSTQAASTVVDGPTAFFDGGDYTGLVALPGGAYAVWPGSAEGRSSLRGAHVAWH